MTSVLTGVLLAAFFGVSLLFRVYFPYDQVFSGEWIKFTSVDAYWHMRLVDNLVHNFPHLIPFDPYQLFPGQISLSLIHFYDWLLAGIINLISWGSPTQNTIDVIGAYFPAVLGALTVIPVYFMGKALSGRWAGIIAAALVAILPGEFLGRSILGFTDHHIAESLFSATAMLFLIMALKTARQKEISFANLRNNRSSLTRTVVYASLAGVMLGIYFITWDGALLFVFIITLYFIIQFISDHLSHKSIDYLCIIGVVTFLIPRLMVIPFSPSTFTNIGLSAAVIIMIVAALISNVMSSKGLKTAYYPMVLTVLGLTGAGLFQIVSPAIFKLILGKFSIFAPTGVSSLTTLEMQGFLFPNGVFSWSVAWGNFSTSFFLLFIALILLTYFFIKRGKPEHGLFLVWSLVILVATFGQRRFAYYLAINVALLIGYLCWESLWFTIFRYAKPAQASTTKTRKKKKIKQPITMRDTRIRAVPAAIIIFLVIFLPNIKPAYEIATQARFAPTDAWQSALGWMENNTPEPFGNKEFYYELYKAPGKEGYKYPDSAYGVTAWWDYGYWITRIAHRLPSSNPGQNPESIVGVANLFLSQDEAGAIEMMAKLKSSYVILDYKPSTTIFWAIVTWASRQESQFSEIYYSFKDNKLTPVRLFYPEYFRSLCTRLYNFDGKSITNPKPIVVSYEDKVSPIGQRYKQVSNALSFATYDDAARYVESQRAGNHRIVSNNPFISPVPLEEYKQFKLVYSSEDTLTQPGVEPVPEVKIFQYLSQPGG